jgi:O-methyltransferase involved in polyketide biosynthesis
MSQIKDVSGTAFVVAEFKAEKNRMPAPLHNDAVAELFLSDESRSAAARIAASFPPSKDMSRCGPSTWMTCWKGI